jgi:hypothetical protein
MMGIINEKPTHIRFDWAIKKLLRSKANFGILEGFLSELLHEDIKIMEILESEGGIDFYMGPRIYTDYHGFSQVGVNSCNFLAGF